MIVYRIVKESYAQALYAPGLPGRWNLRNEYVLYACASAAGALLENLVNRMGQGGLMTTAFACMEIEVPENSIRRLTADELPADFRLELSYQHTQPIGSAWYQAKESLLLEVPSAPAPYTSNYLINTLHPAFREVRILKSYPYPIDKRFQQMDRDLLRLLKEKK